MTKALVINFINACKETRFIATLVVIIIVLHNIIIKLFFLSFLIVAILFQNH